MNHLEIIVNLSINKGKDLKSKGKNKISCMEIFLNSEMPKSTIENIEFYKGSYLGKTNNIMRK